MRSAAVLAGALALILSLTAGVADASGAGQVTAPSITIYTAPSIIGPLGIAAGPDGALWFTQDTGIGRITTTGKVTLYGGAGSPVGITAGPLWFTQQGAGIGRITTSGTVTNYTASGIGQPEGITVGPDGALWFTNRTGNSIGRITTSLASASGAAGTRAARVVITPAKVVTTHAKVVTMYAPGRSG
jgi:virginiamycin B lyase